jgi:hypothetical protein
MSLVTQMRANRFVGQLILAFSTRFRTLSSVVPKLRASFARVYFLAGLFGRAVSVGFTLQ